MTTAHDTHGGEGWQAGVRRRLGLGRLLPLGSAADGAWLAERAAVEALRAAGWRETGGAALLGRVRVGPSDEGGARDGDPDGAGGGAPAGGRAAGVDTGESPVAAALAVPPVPPSALPPGPLTIGAEFEAEQDEPLPALAERLRGALLRCARDTLGLPVTAVDLRVTGLRDGGAGAAAEPATEKSGRVDPDGVPGVTDVPGVAGLTSILGRALTRTPEGDVRVELATADGHRVLDVARAVRGSLARRRPEARSVAVVVTETGVRP
ncbi:hypothetical protein [Streptomyces fuscigenes]|uniref:hypothetical protein n=1 Tax=Streptomyces fuscigenes TaxID=1528880 RepID=UPI001F26C4CD|nr:hypothetical protein [Streptomyces fuscigenes]MCF3961354.1 hypothetical protein [Streptomyces fuscigenes]